MGILSALSSLFGVADSADAVAADISPVPVEEKPIALDVLLYADVPVDQKPKDIPDVWPAQAQEVDPAAPVKPGYTRMTPKQFADYREAFGATYQQWEDAIPPSPEEVQAKADQDALSALRDKPREKWTADDVTTAVQILIASGRF